MWPESPDIHDAVGRHPLDSPAQPGQRGFTEGQKERAALALRDSWRNPASGDNAARGRQLNTARKQVAIILAALREENSE